MPLAAEKVEFEVAFADNRRQLGGRCNSILPYIEEQPRYEMGAGTNLTNKKAVLLIVAQTPLEVLYCPSRR